MSDAPANPDPAPPGLPPDQRGGTSPLRWAFVLAPVLVILVVGAALVQRWAAPLHDALRGAPGSQSESRHAPPIPPSQHEDPAEPAPAPELDVAAVVAAVPDADLTLGARYFRICSICHTAAKGEGHRLGPNLWGIVGRRKAGAANFQYSQALRGLGGTWTDADLVAYLHNPRHFAPGTSMAFAGINDPARLAALVAYLHTLSARHPL
jgi:cytochrome c